MGEKRRGRKTSESKLAGRDCEKDRLYKLQGIEKDGEAICTGPEGRRGSSTLAK